MLTNQMTDARRQDPRFPRPRASKDKTRSFKVLCSATLLGVQGSKTRFGFRVQQAAVDLERALTHGPQGAESALRIVSAGQTNLERSTSFPAIQ